ncbi:MAG: hypothetical protein GY795_13575 [Desulfobacterales bacterium]|nr:hypothetical protein [Desulfobacterales bacterium]
MNLYFLLEGKRTEPKVYPGWINHKFPNLTRVYKIEDISSDCFLLFAAKGYPKILQLIEQSLTDIYNHNANNRIKVDHFFICLDADDGYEIRLNIVNEKVKRIQEENPDISTYLPDLHIIIQNCCIETWFLGNIRMLRRNPQSKRLSDFKRFYDVSDKDPENMGCYNSNDYLFSNKAKFHEAYLKEMFSERNKRYTKLKPGIAATGEYLESLYERCFQTNHLTSLKFLLTIWEDLQ